MCNTLALWLSLLRERLEDLPKTGTRMDDPMSGGLLADALLHEGLLGAEELHGEFVVGGLEEGLELVLDEALLARLGGAQGGGPGLLLGGAVETDIVQAEVDLAGALVVHVVGEEVGDKKRLVVEGRHQRVGARVGILDADLDGVILDQAVWLMLQAHRATDLLLGLSAADNAASAPAAALRRCRRRPQSAVRQAQTGRASAPAAPQRPSPVFVASTAVSVTKRT